MKNIKGLLGLICIGLMFSMVKCNTGPADETKPVDTGQKMSFAAALAATPDSQKITPAGDTLKYFHETKTGTGTTAPQTYVYTYSVPYVVIVPKGTVQPPPDTTAPPSQTFNLSFTEIPFSDPDQNRPGAGAEQWHDRNDVNLGYTPKDVYYRFVWTRLEGPTQGSYKWAYFDGLVNAAINRGQKFSFGIMTVYPDGTTNEGLQAYDGGTMAYPSYLHDLMKTEAVKPWRTGSTWTPAYNSQYYVARLRALHDALNAHINTTSYNGVLYKNVINAIDIRGYGAWGEWHNGYTPNNVVSDFPAGVLPTITTLKKIVDAHTQGFPDKQLVCMIAGFDANWLGNTRNPPEIAYYLLTQRNSRGLIGWRRDQWGATDNYLKDYLENNTRSFNGLVFRDSIMVRYKSAPITGEPPAWSPDAYSDLERQIRLYHATSFGNGNYGTGITSTISARVLASSKAAGYRYQVSTGKVAASAGSLTITLNWANTGLAPTYENWVVNYDLVNASGAIVKTMSSNFTPRLFLGARSVTESFTGLPPGSYKLVLRVSEPYRGNMPLFVKEKNADNTVTLVNKVDL